MGEKIIRDPVHDVIAFETGRPLDGLLFKLLNAAEFQRLRRILQLGMTHLAYPGATHSRYGHSLGVLETARRMLAHVEREARVDEEGRTVCLVSALLHDLGHGPFSHVFERVSGFPHEKLTLRVMQDPDSEVHRLLFRHDRFLPERVAAFFRGEGPVAETFLSDVISSQLDADRFDYLLRDNHMTGSRYGQFDLQWLLHALAVDAGGGRLVVSGKGISAIEDYLHARYNMYRNVYFHKVVRSAEGMVKLALQRARRLAVQDRLDWPPRESAVHKALLGQRLTIGEFTDLDDVAVNYCFKLWAAGDDTVLARLCKGLLYRRVYKTIDLSHITEPEAARVVYGRMADAVEAAGGDRHYDLFYDEPADTPYEADVGGEGEDGGIIVRTREGALEALGRMSPLPGALAQRLMFRRVHVSEEWGDVARGVAAGTA